MATVTVENLRKVFPGHDRDVVALEDVTFGAEGHTFVSIVGPSGCGKSTLLHVAGGLEPPTAGHVLVGGVDLAGLSAEGTAAIRRRTIGFVFQRLNLIASLTALENVVLPLELDGVPTRRARVEARARDGCARTRTSARASR